jgi:hypothetical protein
MNQDPTVPTPHPEELLAAYVDGSAAPAQLEAVEAHLLTCSLCRDEVAIARKARVALTSLPELEAPKVAAAVMAVVGEPHGPAADRSEGVARVGGRWQGMAWAAGLAAAAAVAVVFLFTGVLGDGDSADRPSEFAGATATDAGVSPVPILQGGEYTQETLDTLARDLARDEGRVSAPLSEAEDSSPDSNLLVTTCVQQGAGLGPETQPAYLEEATLDGAPIYVGAFILSDAAGEDEHLELVAVTTDDCQPVYFARI